MIAGHVGRDQGPLRLHQGIFGDRLHRRLEEDRYSVLVMHSDDDQIVPIGAAGLMSVKILKNATLKIYPGFPHGMATTNPGQINTDLLAFFQGAAASS